MLKKFLIGTFALAFMLVAVSQADAASILRVGSSGSEVITVQTAVGASADGMFGPMTKAAVMAFQANHGLVADGIVGPNTWAAINASGTTTTTTTTTTTVDLCPNGMTLASNCTVAPGTTTTVTLCPNGMTLASNCSVAPGSTTPSGLQGGAGSIDSINTFTSGIDSTVKEARDANVLGVEIKASSDSDLAVSTLSLNLTHSSDGSYRLERYVDAVSVYVGSTKVGSANASDFSRTNEVSSKTINLSNVIVKAGEKVRLTVVFEAKDSIQSSSIDASDDIGGLWKVEATAVRYQDATGVVLSRSIVTADNIFADVRFESSTAYDTLSLLSSSLNPSDKNVQVEENSASEDILIGAFKLKAGTDSSNLNVTDIPVVLTSVNTSGTIGDIINDIYLKVGSKIYDNYTASGTTTDIGTYDFSIDSGDLTIASGNYSEVQIFVKFGSQSAKYNSGATVVPSVAVSTITVENAAGDMVTKPTAAFSGNTMTLLVNGASVTYVSDSYIASVGGTTNPSDGTISITFKVENFGDTDVTIAEGQTVATAAGTGVITYAVSNATLSGTGLVTSNDVTKTGTDFIVPAGSTKTFTLSQKFSAQSGWLVLSITNVDNTTVSNTVQTAAY